MNQAAPPTTASLTDSSAPSGELESNPIRGRLNALFFTALDGYVHHLLGSRKRALFRDLPATIVELGSGTGANFRYFPAGARVTAIEPNAHMHTALRRTAELEAIELTVLARGAESTGLESESVDAVVSTLVLCTVGDPAEVAHEVLRILRPGGQFYFLEHVAAADGSATRRLQEIVHRPWSWCFEGCHSHRNTLETLGRAGFAELSAESYTARSPFLPINPQIVGIATK